MGIVFISQSDNSNLESCLEERLSLAIKKSAVICRIRGSKEADMFNCGHALPIAGTTLPNFVDEPVLAVLQFQPAAALRHEGIPWQC